MNAEGWAVLENGKILIQTVHDSPARSAKTWINAHGGAVLPGTTDEQIVDAFESLSHNATLVKVSVTLKKDG